MSSVSKAVAQLLGKLSQVTPNFFNALTSVIGAVVQTTGSGLNDATSGGTSTALVDHVYNVKITTAGGTDHYELSTDGGAYGSSIALTGSAQTLANGVTITFAATTGHTLGDIFTITVTAGVAVAASTLMNIFEAAVGTTAEITIYNGTTSAGPIVYQGITANWSAGRNDSLGYLLSSGSAYVVITGSAAPTIIIGTN